MRNIARLLLSLALAAAMLLQCFAAAAAEPEESTQPEDPTQPETPVSETDAPVISQALVRPTYSEDYAALKPEQTIHDSALVFRIQMEDPMGESGQEPSGVDLAACSLSVDGRTITNTLTDESDMSLIVPVTLAKGRHVLRVVVQDCSGNQSEETYIITVTADTANLIVYSVSSDLDYAPLGGKLTVTIHTPNASTLSALNVSMRADPLEGNDGYEIEAGSGFSLDESSVLFDSDSRTLQFRVRANMALFGERDVVSVTFSIPSDLKEGNNFTYEIPGAWAELRRTDTPDYYEGFSQAARSLPVEAPYTLTVDDLYVGMTDQPYFHVAERNGNKALQAQVFDLEQGFLGLTRSGKLEVPASMLSEPGNYELYASGDLGRSFPVAVTVAAAAQDLESALTFRAQSDPAHSKTVSWISSLHDQVFLRWAKSVPELNQAQPDAVISSRVPFGGEMVQINTYTITGLQPGTTGYLQVSYDGKEWSVVKDFSSCDFSEGINFSLLGSLAAADKEVLHTLTNALSAEQPLLAAQIGDAVQNTASADDWADCLDVLEAVGKTDLLLVPGGRTAGRTSTAVAVQPDGPYSYQYGDVYFAVIPGVYDSAALDWLSRDAAASKCPWKVLLTAAPIEEPDRPAVEQAGIHFVFTDGAYARTPALTDGHTAESYDDSTSTSLRSDGVVFVSCGNYTQETVCLKAEVTRERFVIRCTDLSGESPVELDSFTMLASACAEEGHSFSEQSVYDPSMGSIICDRCGEAIAARKSGYTGFASLADGRAYLERGTAKTGWFYVGGKLMHAGADTRVHQTIDFSTETCTEDGVKMSWCTECMTARSYGSAVSACGHHYDSGHRCTNVHFDAEHHASSCGWKGIDISTLAGELEYLYGYYTGAPLEPTAAVTAPNGDTLDEKEYTISYENNTEIGMAAVHLSGVNSYYGELVLPFEIRPCDVKTIQALDVGQTQLTLSWEEALGAQRYAVYQQTDSGWKRLGDTVKPDYLVTGLSPASNYVFRVRPFANAAFTGKRLDGSLDRTFWAAHHSDSLTVRTERAQFVDVPAEEWFAAPVQWAVDQNITNGTDPTHFSPDNDCTRGQMVTFLWRAKGCPEPTMRSSPFGDVNNPDEYYYQAVLWAVEQGITRGSSATTFSPDAPVTRGMVVTFLHRAAGNQPPVNSVSPFIDVAADQYYAPSVQWAVEQGITNGIDDTHFSPDTICTRAQIVTFLYRFMNK